MQAAYQNGHEEQEIRDEMDMRSTVAKASDGNPLLKQSNLGLGNYTEDYLWQQVASYRKGLFAYIAFGNVLTERAIYQTKMELGRDGYTHFNEAHNEVDHWDGITAKDVGDRQSTWNAEFERGQEIWETLGEAPSPVTEKQVAAVVKKTGVEPGKWLPLYWQMVSGRHDVSRSLNAELLRDLLTGVRHLRDESDSTEAAKTLLGGSA